MLYKISPIIINNQHMLSNSSTSKSDNFICFFKYSISYTVMCINKLEFSTFSNLKNCEECVNFTSNNKYPYVIIRDFIFFNAYSI